jgi:hypothetical protein
MIAVTMEIVSLADSFVARGSDWVVQRMGRMTGAADVLARSRGASYVTVLTKTQSLITSARRKPHFIDQLRSQTRCRRSASRKRPIKRGGPIS